MKRTVFLFLSFVQLLILLSACTSIDCPVQNTVRTLYVLKNPDATADTLTDTLTVVSRRSDGTDTVLLNRAIALSSLSLPIGYTTPEDTLYFQFSHGTYQALDTLWLKKENIPHFESVDCSAAFFHDITAVRSTHHAIDSICINNPSVTYDPTVVNLHIHFKNRR